VDVPWPVVEYLGEQLGIADASCVKRYTDRAMTPLPALLADRVRGVHDRFVSYQDRKKAERYFPAVGPSS